MQNFENVKVVAVSVVYGKRWELLSHVIDNTLSDARVIKFIVFDNNSQNPDLKKKYLAKYPDRLEIIHSAKNLGFSPAIKKVLEVARQINTDRVLILDDDSVPEDGFLDYYLTNLKLFPNPEKIVLTGNRRDVPGNGYFYASKTDEDTAIAGTIFEILSLKKIWEFIKNYILHTKIKTYPFKPILPVKAFVTGGSFIPIQAVREAPLPDETLIMYGEDLKYAWGIRKLGYEAYWCYRPIIRDIDMTFSTTQKNSHIFGLFDDTFPEYKMYLRLRNSIRISREFTYQHSSILFLNILIWFLGLIILGFIYSGFNKKYIRKVKIAYMSLRDGYNKHGLPPDIKLPF